MKDQAAMECEPTPRRDLNNIIVNGGTVNLRLDSQMNNFNNTTDRQNIFLDVGHHFDDCLSTRVRQEYATLQMREGELPRDIMLRHLNTSCLIERPEPMGSTSTKIISSYVYLLLYL